MNVKRIFQETRIASCMLSCKSETYCPQVNKQVFLYEYRTERKRNSGKGLTDPRLTPDLIVSKIKSAEYYLFEGTTTTVCCIKLENGFTAIGYSACASPENFDAEMGEKIALNDAMKRVWELEGYLLKEKLYNKKK